VFVINAPVRLCIYVDGVVLPGIILLPTLPFFNPRLFFYWLVLPVAGFSVVVCGPLSITLVAEDRLDWLI
jgi:hypothetical protein